MPPSVTCEVRQKRGPWEIISVDKAVNMSTRVEKRCVECRGRVMARRTTGTMAAHFEHAQEHKGCSLGDCYDGKGPRAHPAAVI